MSTETTVTAREIDGYRLVKRIGAGGYGEVWKADAPGGLSKAVKLVYGFHDETRAARELKALNRIRNLRHPFLLSLERIEIVDGQLVVVTELADCSLKDRYDLHRKEGKNGVPRDELLRYLADAAEALDYMYETHSLQHLDVKPENLLIVGRHAKVADFGLVKSIQDVTASMMAGLTPLYASPEVFNDQPSRQSDQYSLAIVYQEMLTGTLPFPGRNLAQLTAQHLNSPPRLNSLAPRERDIVGKALAKKLDERYANCREFIEALLAADSIAHVPRINSDDAAGERAGKTDTSTISCSDTSTSGTQVHRSEDPATIRMSQEQQAQVLRDSQVWNPIRPARQSVLSERKDDASLRVLRPTVVIGIGGLGNRIVRGFQQRRQELVGNQSHDHWCQLVAVDTDLSDLLKSTGQPVGTKCAPGLRTVEMPLRRPQAYRGLSSQLTRSLSRRWLYNIPLSLKTEGMRPLGRLAFVDHSQKLRENLTRAIDASKSLAEQNIESSDSFQWSPEPRVVLVAACGGGTGSGMVWDALAMAHDIVQKQGGHSADVALWLIHAEGRTSEQQDLARSNTYACLRELHHYQVQGRYPGDPVSGVPSLVWNEELSRQITLFETADQDNERSIESDLSELADLLYLDVYEGRHAVSSTSARSSSGQASLRTLSFASKALCSSGQLDTIAANLSLSLVHRWLGKACVADDQHRMAQLRDTDVKDVVRQEPRKRDLELRAARVLHECELDLEHAIDVVKGFVEEEMESTPDTYFTEVIDRLVDARQLQPGGSHAEISSRVLDSLDQLIGVSQPEIESITLQDVSLHNEIAPLVRSFAEMINAKMLERIHAALDEPALRLQGAKMLAGEIDHQLRDLEQKARAMGERTTMEVSKLRDTLLTIPDRSRRGSAKLPPATSPADLRLHWISYASLRVHGVVIASACQIFQHLRGAILRDNLWIKHTTTSLELTAEKLRRLVPEAIETGSSDPQLLERIMLLDQSIEGAILQLYGGLCHLLHEEREGPDKLAKQLMECGREVARNSAVQGAAAAQSPHGSDMDLIWSHRTAAGACRLTQLGPLVQRVEYVSDSCDVLSAAERFKHASKLETKLPKIVWVETAYGVPLRDAARLLVDNRPDYVPVADRLVTRADIDWLPL